MAFKSEPGFLKKKSERIPWPTRVLPWITWRTLANTSEVTGWIWYGNYNYIHPLLAIIDDRIFKKASIIAWYRSVYSNICLLKNMFTQKNRKPGNQWLQKNTFTQTYVYSKICLLKKIIWTLHRIYCSHRLWVIANSTHMTCLKYSTVKYVLLTIININYGTIM